ncbi:MAG: hypothetical protein RLZZ273_221 [Bacteroidota bacterium]
MPNGTLVAQYTVGRCDLLSETDGQQAPLRAISSELALEIAPAPFGHADLSQMRVALGMPSQGAALGLLVRGAPGMVHTATCGRLLWQPKKDYRVSAQLTGDWYAIAAFPDQWSACLNLAAEMTISHWAMSAGLFDALVWGRREDPSMLISITHYMPNMRVAVELSSSWSATPVCTISACVALADSISAGFGIGASPLSIDTTIRFPAGNNLDVVLGIQQRELLGIQPRIILCWRSPSWLHVP